MSSKDFSVGRGHVRRVWVADVGVDADALETHLERLRTRPTAQIQSEEREVIARGVYQHLEAARAAATRSDPVPARFSNWWRGTLVEFAYQNLHAAEALIVGLYDTKELEAEIPDAVARVNMGLDRKDPRRRAVLRLVSETDSDPARREQLRKAMEVGFSASEAEYVRLRSFRNAIVSSIVMATVVLLTFVVFVNLNPTVISFCFSPADQPTACPAGGSGPTPHDVLAVALLGMLGGVMAAILAITLGGTSISHHVLSMLRDARGTTGTALAHDLPHFLAFLKLPLGALSAIGGS